MPLYSLLLTSLLVSQIGAIPPLPVTTPPPTTNPAGPAIPAATFPGTPATGGAIISQPLTAPAHSVQPSAASAKATTAQLVAEALTLPPGSTITGQAVSLVSVVATVPDRPRQIEAVHAYWRLADAVGEYHFCQDRQQRLARLRAGNDEAADLKTAQAIAAAQVAEAELQVTTAQHDLAEILLLVQGTPLPLPADQPLVGPYRTLFAELFAGKSAPQRAAMLDQTLPLRNRAVESHAAALLAAEDALDATIELQPGGQERVSGVIAALDAQVREQRAFLAAVCRYNHDIADYALVVVSPQTSPEMLVGTLIKQNRPAGQAVTPLPTTAVVPATYGQPIVAPPAGGAGIPPAMPNRPTRALPPGAAAGQTPPAFVPVGGQEAAPMFPPSEVLPPDSPPSHDPDEPRLAPPQESAIPMIPELPDSGTPPATSTKSQGGPTPHSSQMPIGDGSLPQASALETFPGLAGQPPAEQTVKLTAALYQDRNLPSYPRPGGEARSASEAMRLIDCLRTVPSSGREKAIVAYWSLRQAAAQQQSFAEQIEWLESVKPALARKIRRRPRRC